MENSDTVDIDYEKEYPRLKKEYERVCRAFQKLLDEYNALHISCLLNSNEE